MTYKFFKILNARNPMLKDTETYKENHCIYLFPNVKWSLFVMNSSLVLKLNPAHCDELGGEARSSSLS